jgi:hypothetical protein
MLLARLAIHYYRPEFTERHAALMIEDFAIDLADFAVPDIEEAIRCYRQNGRNKYFPTSGQLRDLAKEIRKDRQDIQAHGSSSFDRRGQEFGETRPSMWWLLRREWWKPHWTENQIPEKEKPDYFRWKEAKAAKEIPCVTTIT